MRNTALNFWKNFMEKFMQGIYKMNVSVNYAPLFISRASRHRLSGNNFSGGRMKRYSEEARARLVGEWEQSGKSKWAFARDAGVSYPTFSAWTRAPGPEAGFVEVSGSLAGEGGERTEGALVVERGTIRVHLPAGFRAKDLAVVIRAMSEARP
jgi:transposase-like protein